MRPVEAEDDVTELWQTAPDQPYVAQDSDSDFFDDEDHSRISAHGGRAPRRSDFESEPRRGAGRRLLLGLLVVAGVAFVSTLGVMVIAAYFPDMSQQLRQSLARSVGEAPPETAAQTPLPVAQSDQQQAQFTRPEPVQAPAQSSGEPEVQRPMPNVDGLVMLIRSNLNALNQANRTNNYSILREISASDFQKANSGARLSDVFADLRGRNVDLMAINVINPQLIRDPEIDANGFLRLAGFFPSRPEQVNFQFEFAFEDNSWRLFGVGVETAVPANDGAAPAEPSPGPPVASKPLPPQQTPQINRQPTMPDEATVAALARDAVVALNHANRTGNYSILRDLGAPGFQQINTNKRLAGSFAELRQRQLNLTPINAINPRLFRPPVIDERGMLRLTGFFPSRPEQVNFDLAFQKIGEDWKIFGIGVNTSMLVPGGDPAAASSAPTGQPAEAQAGSGQANPAPAAPPSPRPRPIQ